MAYCMIPAARNLRMLTRAYAPAIGSPSHAEQVSFV